jgi:hypothetical protein
VSGRARRGSARAGGMDRGKSFCWSELRGRFRFGPISIVGRAIVEGAARRATGTFKMKGGGLALLGFGAGRFARIIGPRDRQRPPN